MKIERAARFLFVPFVLVVASAYTIACGSDEPASPAAQQSAAKPKSDEPAPPAAAAAPKQKLTPRSQREQLPEPSPSATLSSKVDLPDFYPDDAPVYKGATTNSAGWQSGRVNAVFSTKDDLETVSREVQSALRSDGWGEIVAAEMENGVVVQAGKDDRSLSALISRMEEGTPAEVTMIMVAVDP